MHGVRVPSVTNPVVHVSYEIVLEIFSRNVKLVTGFWFSAVAYFGLTLTHCSQA